MSDHSRYISPFSTRYASPEMQFVFSEDNKFRTWRRLWIALARAEQKQGLPITDEQIAELEAHKDDINYDDAQRRERECRHDVMSHVYAYGLQCPKARGIIHLGATSCYVGDNTDVILMKQGLEIVRRKVLNVMDLLARFAEKYKALPALAYTHLQPAQLTTVGKRATLWLNELYMDFEEIEHRIGTLALLGSKGTTGTQASFMELLGGDSGKIRQIEQDIAAEMGFTRVVPVSGQTYSRKMDYMVVSTLSGIAQTASKFSYDMRLLQNFKEMEEPFEKSQIGSSAMPYKRNPMRSERVSSLSRYVMVDTLNTAITAGTQWFERTLDDSANKRIAVAEAFLGVDAILNIYANVAGGLVILSSHPFSIGDYVEVSGVAGTVHEIGLNHTKLVTPDGHLVMLPNKELASSQMTNYTVLGKRRVVQKVTASYEAPTETVKAACRRALELTDNLLDDPPPAVYLTAYQESSIQYTVYCWATPDNWWGAYLALGEHLRDAFQEFGVEMTYDHLNVHVIEK